MERKTFPNFSLKLDADQGIVEHIFAVFGNVDLGDDILHPGSFAKTITERFAKIRVLDQHNNASIMSALGKPLEIREIPREELPAELLAQYPDATGGVYAKTQFLMETPEGKGAFIRLKEGAIDEWSFSYDPVKGGTDYSKLADGRTVRNLREIKLYEYGPVLWGMNPATTTLDAKNTPDAAAEKAGMRPPENKAINLSKRIDDVVRTFYQAYPDIHDSDTRFHVVYWVKQIWDEFLIVDQEGTQGTRTWKISYVVSETNTINFAFPPDWIEVTMAFVPVQPPNQLNTAPQIGAAEDGAQMSADEQHDDKAGPQPTAPTSEEMLRLIEIEESEITLIEVKL